MTKERGLKLILIIIASCILINSSINIYYSINQKKLIREYEQRRENYMKYLEYPVPISDNKLNNLRSFMRETDNDSLEVIPFNDGINCFVSGKSDQYILNIENKELLWTRGYYYESPIFDTVTDTLTCGGDLSATDYVFNKYGELIETKEYGITKVFLTLWIFNFTAIVSALFTIQLMVNKNVKSIGIKLITNIFLVL